MWNNKGNITIFYTFMLGLTILILVLALAPGVAQFTNNARNDTTYTDFTNADGVVGQIENAGMNCSSSTIDNFSKLGCYATDINLFLYIGVLIFISGSVIAAKLFFGGE